MRILSLSLVLYLITSITYVYALPFYKKTDHFIIECLPSEYKVADAIADEAEKFFTQISHELEHIYDNSITIRIYSNIKALHDSLQELEEDVLTNTRALNHSYALINPYNSNFANSFENMVNEKFINVNNALLADLFLINKYPNSVIPKWLHQGCALYFAHYFPDGVIELFKNSIQAFPSIEELERFDKNDNEESMDIDDLIASYLLVRFIDIQWNRTTLLALLDNYENFEKILHHLKKNVEKYWNYCTFFETLGFKSGDASFSQEFINDLFIPFQKALSTPGKRAKAFEAEQIQQFFEIYKDKILHTDDHLLMLIKARTEIVGWALFAIQSESQAQLKMLCIDPDYSEYEIGKKIVNNLHRKFHAIRSIITANKHMEIKLPYCCAAL